jgi:cytochrome c5
VKALLPLLLVLGACARTTAPHATPEDASRAQLRWPGTTAADLERGRDLYVGHCSSCHLPPTPSDYAPDEWPGRLAEMRTRAHLDAEVEEQIRRYVVTMASN